jgi:phospho-N-acetylmuramoyl-pentapeptide-transferase
VFYYLFDLLNKVNFPGARLFEYVTFRSGAAFVLALLIATIIGRSIIDRLQKMQVGEVIRNLGIEGQMKKTGTPTMGGITHAVHNLMAGSLRIYRRLFETENARQSRHERKI